MIALIGKKLRAHGVKKIVPDKTLLAEVYTELEKGRRLQEIFPSRKRGQPLQAGKLTQALRGMGYEVDEGSMVDKLDDIKMSGFKAPTNLESSVRKWPV